jgi:hypothetical protein
MAFCLYFLRFQRLEKKLGKIITGKIILNPRNLRVLAQPPGTAFYYPSTFCFLPLRCRRNSTSLFRLRLRCERFSIRSTCNHLMTSELMESTNLISEGLPFADFIHSLVKIPCFRCIPWWKFLVAALPRWVFRGSRFPFAPIRVHSRNS